MNLTSFDTPQPSGDVKTHLGLRSVLRANGYGQAVVGLAMVLVGLWFQDYSHVLWFSAVSISFLFYARFTDRIPSSNLRFSFKSIMFVATIGGQFFLPQGPASAMLFYMFISTVLVVSEKAMGGFISTVGIITLYLMLPNVGIEYLVETGVPSWSSFLTLLLCSTIALLIQFSKARHTVSQSLGSLSVTEELISQEMAHISKRNLLLHEGNRSLERGTLFLNDTLEAEAKSTIKLSAKRDDQKRLTNAIHQDMSEPLRGIVSFSQLIKRKLSNRPEADDVQEYLGYAIDGGQRMAKMLSDLLMYSKNNHSEKPHLVDLTELLSEVQFDIQDLVERSGATIEIGHLPTITGYETQLKQLFQNLLSNALKFRKEGVAPHVIIQESEEQKDPGLFVIEIKDNGVGIPKNQLAKVFGLFNRAHDEGGYEGSGVGLALCRRIAISHGATLTVESADGEGATFLFALPIRSVVSVSIKKPTAIQHKESVNYE